MNALCRTLEVSLNGYYAWQRGPSHHAQDDQRLGARIGQLFAAGRGVYGSPRVQALRHAEGTHCGRKRVARLMQEQGLLARRAAAHAADH